MANSLIDARKHTVFPAERRGAALVVRPQGDAAGFGHAVMKVERERILKLLESPEIPNLILDMGDTNYFGSEMIGVFSRMIAIVRDRGGSHAVVNLSDDMREGIAIMKLDEVWNVREKRVAYRELATENPLAPIRRNIWTILVLLVAVTVVGGAAYAISRIPRQRDRAEYMVLHEVWDEYREKRPTLHDLRLVQWKKRSLERVQEVAERLEKSNYAKRTELQHMLAAAREQLPVMLDPNLRMADQVTVDRFLQEMVRANLYLRGRYPGLELPPVLDFDGAPVAMISAYRKDNTEPRGDNKPEADDGETDDGDSDDGSKDDDGADAATPGDEDAGSPEGEDSENTETDVPDED